MDEWVYSTSDEYFGSDRYPSADAAFAAWVAEDDPEEGEGVYIGRVVNHTAGEFPITHDPLGNLSEHASEECGECTNDWPKATCEQEQDLEAMLADAVNAWADKHSLQPKFYTVEDIDRRTYATEVEP
jgi:hypothetical protein